MESIRTFLGGAQPADCGITGIWVQQIEHRHLERALVNEEIGHGMRPTVDIEPHGFITIYGGELLTREQAKQRGTTTHIKALSHDGPVVDGINVKDLPSTHWGALANSSCDPNACFEKVRSAAWSRELQGLLPNIVVLRAGANGIKAGEWIEVDYRIATAAAPVDSEGGEGTSHDSAQGLRSPSSGRDVTDRASGGCDARTLVNLGVYSDDAAAKEALNAQIDNVHQIFLKNDASCKRECAGLEDVEWSNEVVSKAVREAGFHMVKVQRGVDGAKHVRDVDLKTMFKGGEGYFVDGFLNRQYVRGSKKVPIRVAGSTDNRWRHSTAVVGNQVLDHPAFILGGSMSASYLHLDGHSTPNRQKGFLREILRAYRVFKCKRPGTGCKGGCAK